TALIIGGFTIAITLLAMPIIKALTMGGSEPKLVLGTVFAFWTLPQIFFYGVYAIVGQELNAHARVGAYRWAPVANIRIAIGFIISRTFSLGPYPGEAGKERLSDRRTTQTVVLAGGHTLGIIFQAVVLLWRLKRLGLNLKPKGGWKGMGLRHTGQ